MKHYKKFAFLFVTAWAFSLAAASARPQTSTPPIVVKSKPAPAVKPIKARFEVLNMMINAIQVRNPENLREIHTFIYSDGIRDRMQNLFNNSAYQYGDVVVIRYMRGTDIALNIEGKPSKPI